MRELVTLAEAGAQEAVVDILLTRGRVCVNPPEPTTDRIVLVDEPAPRP